MKSKTTPGTWKNGTNTNSNEWMKIFADGKPIGRALELSKAGARKATDFEQEQANAKLMAASKDLLEALTMAYAFMCTDTQHQGRQILETMKEAIQKATN